MAKTRKSETGPRGGGTPIGENVPFLWEAITGIIQGSISFGRIMILGEGQGIP